MLNRFGASKLLSGVLIGACAGAMATWTVSLPAQQEELPLNHPPQAQMAWTSIGATGTPDDGDAELVRFGANGAVAVTDGLAFPTVAVLRYNVVSTLGLYALPENRGDPVPRCLDVAYRDNGPHARVIVRLKRLMPDVGVQTVATFDSDFHVNGQPRLSAGENFTEIHDVCTIPPGTFSAMNQQVFFLEAQLFRTSAAGNPGLQSMTIEADSP
jgi:hypothetical protein